VVKAFPSCTESRPPSRQHMDTLHSAHCFFQICSHDRRAEMHHHSRCQSGTCAQFHDALAVHWWEFPITECSSNGNTGRPHAFGHTSAQFVDVDVHISFLV